MKKGYQTGLFGAMILGVVVFCAVSWHSVDEIHYLKSFFPKQFTVQEAYYATAIELIKVILIGLPILLVVIVGFKILKHLESKD